MCGRAAHREEEVGGREEAGGEEEEAGGEEEEDAGEKTEVRERRVGERDMATLAVPTATPHST